MKKGVIFDFNGTLFWDSMLHFIAWRVYSKQLTGKPFSDEEMLEYMFGHTNEDILTYALGKKPDKALLDRYASEKEAYYRKMCLESPDEFKLAPHAEEFLDYLKENQVPMAIATMSEWCNVEFYLKEFNLQRWFDLDKIVYSDGTIPGKPAPDIYLIAAKRLGLDPKDCTVFEDAVAGLRSAHAAGAGEIIAVASNEPMEYYDNIPYVSRVITDFDQVLCTKN